MNEVLIRNENGIRYMNRKISFLAVFVVVLIGLASLSGCFGNDPYSEENSNDDVVEDEESYTVWTPLNFSSLDFTVEIVCHASYGNYTIFERYQGKKLDTEKPDMRVNITSMGETKIYVVFGENKTGYVKVKKSNWTTFNESESYDFSSRWYYYLPRAQDFYNHTVGVNQTMSWNGTYGDFPASFEIINLTRNPTFPDSVFNPIK